MFLNGSYDKLLNKIPIETRHELLNVIKEVSEKQLCSLTKLINTLQTLTKQDNNNVKDARKYADGAPGEDSLQIVPKTSDEIYIVRIGNHSGAKAARKDYSLLKQQIEQKGKCVWDKDSHNKIKPGNWIGFIIGPNNDEDVELYYIESEESTETRPKHWHNLKPYTNQTTQTLPKKREVIVLKNQSPIKFSWKKWKKLVGYKENYMPRGTTKAKSPYYFNNFILA